MMLSLLSLMLLYAIRLIAVVAVFIAVPVVLRRCD